MTFFEPSIMTTSRCLYFSILASLFIWSTATFYLRYLKSILASRTSTWMVAIVLVRLDAVLLCCISNISTSPTYLQRSTGISDWPTEVCCIHGEHQRGYWTIRNQYIIYADDMQLQKHIRLAAIKINRSILEQCVAEIKDRCSSMHLQLNAEKNEVLVWFTGKFKEDVNDGYYSADLFYHRFASCISA